MKMKSGDFVLTGTVYMATGWGGQSAEERVLKEFIEEATEKLPDHFCGRFNVVNLEVEERKELVCAGCDSEDPKGVNQCPGCGSYVCRKCEETMSHECSTCVGNNIGGVEYVILHGGISAP